MKARAKKRAPALRDGKEKGGMVCPTSKGTHGGFQGRALLSYQVRAYGQSGMVPRNQLRFRLERKEVMMTVELVNTSQGYKNTKWDIPFTSHERP